LLSNLTKRPFSKYRQLQAVELIG